MSEERFQLIRLLEAMLFAAVEPMPKPAMVQRLPEGADLEGLLTELQQLYANRGIHLIQHDDRWCFRTAPDLAERLAIETTVTRKLSRAAIETLAIVAYHQPVTRGEIEEIRGVIISQGTLDRLLEIGWIKPKGRRQTPGRPVTWVTTESFLEQFGLDSLDALPGIEELRAAGLLDARPAISTLGAQVMAAMANGSGNGEAADDAEEDDGEEGGDEEDGVEPAAGDRPGGDRSGEDEDRDGGEDADDGAGDDEEGTLAADAPGGAAIEDPLDAPEPDADREIGEPR
ncbi:MAG: SMC-Scp complex subunit ScpB [Dongiaceae bacterium]